MSLTTAAADNVDRTDAVKLWLINHSMPDYMYPLVRGFLIHREFSRLVNETGNPQFRGESVSYYKKTTTFWGRVDSIRPGIIWGNVANPYLAFEPKKGQVFTIEMH